MNERKLSELQKEYRTFFLEKMRLYGVKSPVELTKAKKSEFFTEIKQDWAKYKLSKKQLNKFDNKKTQATIEEPVEIYFDKSTKDAKKESSLTVTERSQKKLSSHSNKEKEQQHTEKRAPRQGDERPPQKFAKKNH